MVYKLYLDGENIDAQYGQPMTFSQFFVGKYGSALSKAEELLRLVDSGVVSVSEKSLNGDVKPVYVAVKELASGNIVRHELN